MFVVGDGVVIDMGVTIVDEVVVNVEVVVVVVVDGVVGVGVVVVSMVVELFGFGVGIKEGAAGDRTGAANK